MLVTDWVRIGSDKRIQTPVKIKVFLWDVASQQRLRNSFSLVFIRSADCIILTYDTTDPQALKRLEMEWMPIVFKMKKQDCRLLLLGTKTDLERRISAEVESL
jgi:GTPase SAR1 family protein